MNLAVGVVIVNRVGPGRAAAPLAGWFVFLGLLGPAGIARLDAVMMPLVVPALLYCASRPALASVLVTISAWIKVSGGAVIIPLLALVRTWREALIRVVAPAGLTCMVVVVAQRLFGGTWENLATFVTAENTRGLQVEAVLATPVVLAHAAAGEAVAEYNWELGTNETWGAGAETAIQVSDLAMPAVVVMVGVMLWFARKHPVDAMLVGSLAILTGLICAHKVGSPQFVAWIAPPILVALALRRDTAFWGATGVGALVAAGLTGLLFPWGYMGFLNGEWPWLALFTVRNVLLVAIFVAAAVKLVLLARRPASEYPGSGDGSREEHQMVEAW
jgi:hypothetical protein